MRIRWGEFFEDTCRRLSMSRLLCFLSFFPATYVVVLTRSTEALGWYLGAYVVGYIGGKGAEVFQKPKRRKQTEEGDV